MRCCRAADKLVNGEHVAVERHRLSMRTYLHQQILGMLERAGFDVVDVEGDHRAEPLRSDSRFAVYHARKR
jgi:hypothetical protein